MRYHCDKCGERIPGGMSICPNCKKYAPVTDDTPKDHPTEEIETFNIVSEPPKPKGIVIW